MELMIEVKDVQFDYLSYEGQEVAALNGVTLDVKKGEFVVIIGHNGSGKSTLAKHFNALLKPSKGVVLIKGIDTRDEDMVWEIRQTAGMVFQNPDNQIVATIVEEDVAFGPENLGLPAEEIRIRVDEALKTVGMDKYANSAPHYLSGGQKQRVAIAGILAMRPEVIVLDEPTAMLDPSGRREVIETIKYLNKHEGITVVHITHYMEEAVDAFRSISELLISRSPPLETAFSNLSSDGLFMAITAVALVIMGEATISSDMITLQLAVPPRISGP
jgi:energy-coupling factor transport system ATP-binding protein